MACLAPVITVHVLSGSVNSDLEQTPIVYLLKNRKCKVNLLSIILLL